VRLAIGLEDPLAGSGRAQVPELTRVVLPTPLIGSDGVAHGVGGAAVAIEAHHLEGAAIVVAARELRPLLDHQHGVPPGGQRLRDGGAARAGAHDDDVALHHLAVGERAGVEDLLAPARALGFLRGLDGKALAERGVDRRVVEAASRHQRAR
jgi:hypothetical protein